MLATDILFYILAAVTVVTSIGVITARNPVYSALLLVVTLFAVAGLYLTLNAEFLAVVQVLTYAGAVLVLFVFIVMLLNLSPAELKEKTLSKPGLFILTLLTAVGFASVAYLFRWGSVEATSRSPLPEDFGSIQSVGKLMFTQYIIPFEIAGVLLTVALIGAVLLAKKNLAVKK